MLFTIFFIIASIFQSYELWLLYRCLFGKSKRGGWMEFAAFLLFFIVTSSLYLFVNIPLLTGLVSYGVLVLIAFFLVREWMEKRTFVFSLCFCQHDFSRMYRGTCNRIFGFKRISVERIL